MTMDDAPNAAPFTPSRQRAGNIDLSNRPRVRNADGSISTVRSISVEIDGLVYLIPTVVGDRVVSNDEAIRHFRSSGQYLGIFESEVAADQYAEQLHAQQEQTIGASTMQRQTPTDIPSRVPNGRMVTIRTNYGDGTNYEIDSGRGFEQATHAGSKVLAQGDIVGAHRNSATGGWEIEPQSDASAEASVGDEVISASYEGVAGGTNPPAFAWPVSSTIGTKYGPSVLSGTGAESNYRVAWHPSGRAVAILSNEAIRVWEWLPGVGWGRQYTPMFFNYARYDALNFFKTYYEGSPTPTDFRYPGLFAADIAFSPDGQYLAIVGTDGYYDQGFTAYNANLMIVRFDLSTGIDWIHPLISGTDASSFGDINGVAWHPSGNYIAVAADGGVLVYEFDPSDSGSFVGGGVPIEPAEQADLPTMLRVAWAPSGDYLAAGCEQDNFSVGGTNDSSVLVWAWTGTAFGALVADSVDLARDEIWSLEWHPGGEYIMFKAFADNDVDCGLYAYPFNPAGGGSFGAMITIDTVVNWGFGDPLIEGGSFSPDGTKIAAAWDNVDGAFHPELRLYSFAAGVAALLDSELGADVAFLALYETPRFRPALAA